MQRPHNTTSSQRQSGISATNIVGMLGIACNAALSYFNKSIVGI